MVENNPLKVTNVLGCSYHPKSCTCDPTMINFEAEHFKLEYGTAGLTFPCYQSSLNPRHVTRSKSIRTSDMVHAILWPSIGNFPNYMANFKDFCLEMRIFFTFIESNERGYSIVCWLWWFLVVSSRQFAITVHLLRINIRYFIYHIISSYYIYIILYYIPYQHTYLEIEIIFKLIYLEFHIRIFENLLIDQFSGNKLWYIKYVWTVPLSWIILKLIKTRSCNYLNF